MKLAPENYGGDVKWISSYQRVHFNPIKCHNGDYQSKFFILIKKYIFKRNSKNEKLAEQGRYDPGVERRGRFGASNG